MKEKKEFLAFEFKVSDVNDNETTGYIEGYASTFGNIDLGDDIVERGAFRKTINDKGGKFPILLDHDYRKQIGWNIEATEDERGLKVRGEIQLITEDARNRYLLAKRAKELGTKMGLSIGYSAVKWEMETLNDTQRVIRKLKEIKLFEYSLVTFPMNEEAGIERAKTQQLTALFDALQNGSYDLDKIQKALALVDQSKQAANQTEADPELFQSVDRLILMLQR